ncbi:MAG: M42 family metallopeptidase [Clostridia bacterium]|nr:M42 family metallopeptidase [Clostridia bacterium]
MFTLIKELCNINGTSGREDKVREYIISKLGENSYTVDNLGNLIVEVKGKNRAKNKVMVCAHMDEVGFIATYVSEDGLIKFDTVGGILPAVMSGRKIVFENGTVGVIGSKPVHLSSAEEKNTLLNKDKLYIDIGAKDKNEAMKYVIPGDTAVFVGEFTDLGEKILSKALDDRVGCAIMLKMIEEGMEYDTVFVFSVQEEVGTRGAGCAVNRIYPDFSVVLESTTAADIIGIAGEKRVCVQGEGAVISFMDNSTLYDKEVFKTALKIGEEKGIKVQVKTAVAGGNDSGAIHKSAYGVRAAAISAPCRYIHSQSNLLMKSDIVACFELAKALTENLSHA